MKTKTEAKLQHTPTPWRVAPNEPLIVETVDGMEIADVSRFNERMLKVEDAAFIVRAVNCHGELLAALKHIHPSLYHRHKDDGIACRKCEFAQAIAKAEGR